MGAPFSPVPWEPGREWAAPSASERGPRRALCSSLCWHSTITKGVKKNDPKSRFAIPNFVPNLVIEFFISYGNSGT